MRNGAPSAPVMTPTGNRVPSAYCATKSATSTSSAPNSPDASTGEPTGPRMRAVIGPERKATNAIGPAAAVPKAMSATAQTISSTRTRSTGTPSAAAAWSPSRSASRSRVRRSSTGVSTTTASSSGSSRS